MGSDYAYIAPTSTVTLNYHDAVDYCLANHNAELPKLHQEEDLLGILIAQRTLGSKESVLFKLLLFIFFDCLQRISFLFFQFKSASPLSFTHFSFNFLFS